MRPAAGGCCPLAGALLLLLGVLLRAGPGRALVCLPCDESKCEEEPRSCAGSVVLGVCGCCFRCARQKNESCGGVYGLHGACDRGLRCVLRPPLTGASITEYQVGVCEDENWDDDQLLGFEPCNENFVTGCNIINGKCECDTIRTCNNPFEFASKDACLSALRRIEVVGILSNRKAVTVSRSKKNGLAVSMECQQTSTKEVTKCNVIFFKRIKKDICVAYLPTLRSECNKCSQVFMDCD